MARSGTFSVKFTQDGAGNLVATFDKIEGKAKETEQALSQAEKTAYDFGVKLGNALKWTGAGVVAGLALVVRNTIQAEQELAQLDAVLKSSGQSASFTRDQLVDMAEGIARASTFSAGEITKAETRLLSYSGIAEGNFADALQIAIDQAQRLGISVEQSAEIIGRALESPTKAAAALAQQGFGAAFTQSVRESIKALEDAGRTAEAQQIVLDILRESYAGAAQAARDTFGGALQALMHTLGDLTTGGEGSLDGATEAVNDLINTLNDPRVKDGAGEVVAGLTQIATASVQAVSWLGNAAAALREYYGELDKKGTVSLINQRTELETELFGEQRAQRRSWLGGAAVENAPRVKELKARIAEIDKILRDRNVAAAAAAAAKIETPAGFSPAYELASLNFNPNPRRQAASGGGASRATVRKSLSDEDRAARQLQDSYRSLNAQYERRLALVGDSSEAAALAYDMEHGRLQGLTDAMAKLVFGYDTAAEARERLLNTARAIDVEEDYQAIYGPGGFLEQQQEKTRETFNAMSEFARQAGRNMQDAFADFLFDPFADGSRSMADNFAIALRRMAAEMAASRLFDALGNWGNNNAGSGGWQGALGGLLSGLFGGASGKASGGGVRAGELYRVAEGGQPEVFRQNGRTYLIPGDTGEVVPAMRGALAGARAAGPAAWPLVNVTIEKGAPEDRVEQSRGADGSLNLRIMVRDAVRGFIGDGSLDDVAGASWGVRRRGASYG